MVGLVISGLVEVFNFSIRLFSLCRVYIKICWFFIISELEGFLLDFVVVLFIKILIIYMKYFNVFLKN